MNFTKQSFILAMILMLGVGFFPGVTTAAIVSPDFQASASVNDWSNDGSGQSPFEIVSPERETGVRIGYSPKFIETWVESGGYAYGQVTWSFPEGESHDITLAFTYRADAGSWVSWDTPEEYWYGISDGVWRSVDLAFTIDGGYTVTLAISNNGGQAFIADLQGLPTSSTAHTPIPGSVLLLGTGLLGLGALGRRRRG